LLAGFRWLAFVGGGGTFRRRAAELGVLFTPIEGFDASEGEMCQPLAMVYQIVNALRMLASVDGGALAGAHGGGGGANLDREMHAIAEMYTFQRTGGTVSAADEALDRKVGDVVAFDQTNPSKLGQEGELADTGIGETGAARKIDVSNPGTSLDQRSHGPIRDIAAVAQVQVVQVLAQRRDRVHSPVGDVATLGQDQDPQARCHLDNLINSFIRDQAAVSKIQDAQAVELLVGDLQEGVVRQQVTVGKTYLADTVEVAEEMCDRPISDLVAAVEINLQQLRAVRGQRENGGIRDLRTVVELQLFMLSISIKFRITCEHEPCAASAGFQTAESVTRPSPSCSQRDSIPATWDSSRRQPSGYGR
jgi:hypothetical protein